MTLLEILLLILGVIVFVASFIIPEKEEELDESQKQMTKQQIHEMMQQEVENARQQVSDAVEETVSYSVEKSERALERLTNDKIQAISEYSGTVLSDIHKNHEETVFLYDMLNSKHENLKETASEVSQAVKQASEAVSEVHKTKQEALEVSQALDEAILNAVDTEFVPMDFADMQRIDGENIIEMVKPDEANQMVDNQPDEENGEQVSSELETKTPAKRKTTSRKTTAKKTTTKTTKSASKKSASPSASSDVNISFDIGQGANQNSNDMILKLHKEGKSNVAIAKELGLGVGEVKLVIDLFDSVNQL